MRIADASVLGGIMALVIIVLLVLAMARFAIPNVSQEDHMATPTTTGQVIKLPRPQQDGKMSVERSLRERRSVREFSEEPLTLAEIAQILWAAQGTTDPSGLRTAPSAGALYPLEVYVVAGRVHGLSQGVYKYRPRGHELAQVAAGDRRAELYAAAIGQESVRDAAAVVVITAVYERTTIKYGERGIRYVHMEVGHVGQNIYLQAVSLGLGTVAVGAFDDEDVRRIIGAPHNEHPLYLMPIGKR